METTEYIEYCEEIKGEEENSELSQGRKYSEYFEEDFKNDIEDKVKREIEAEDEKKRNNSNIFEEDVKEEIIDEKNFHSTLEKQLWAHTVSEHESPVSLYSMWT